MGGMNLFDEDNTDTSTAIFSSNYKCFSHNFSSSTDSKKEELSRGGKILLPATALEKLTNLNVSYPMLFKLNSKQKTVEEEDVLEGYKRGLPNYNWTFGELNFSRVENRDDNKTEEETFTAFSGQ